MVCSNQKSTLIFHAMNNHAGRMTPVVIKSLFSRADSRGCSSTT